ncbi:MAG: enoyl-CoA hydratase-related protein [bacterium]
MANYENFLLEVKDNVAVVTFNRPAAMNALNSALIKELEIIVDRLLVDNEVWGVIFTGAGDKAFIAGADIKELATLNAVSAPIWARDLQRIFMKVESMHKPVIAAINGFCLGGGCEFAMSCHMRVASEKARIGQPEVHLGIIPGAMGTIRLPRLVGKGWATEMILTGRMIKAADAERIGLVNHVVEPDKLMDKCFEIMKEIFKNGGLACRFALESIQHGLTMTPIEGGNLEADLFGLCYATEDSQEGLTAFVEKRDPKFHYK